MKRSNWIIGIVFLAATAPVHAGESPWDDLLRGGVVVDHQPIQSGGPAADTDFFDVFGAQTFQRLADDILLAAPATIRAVSWWGFYGGDEQSPDPPLGDETMRVRFYGARPSDGLPDEQNIIFEESFLNPSRTATGEIIFVGGLRNEFLYDAELTTPISLQASTPYWVEIVQVGDINSTFRWEFAFTDQNGFAFVNGNVPDWQPANLTVDLAFQLSTIPEPATFFMVLLGGVFISTRGRKERWRG